MIFSPSTRTKIHASLLLIARKRFKRAELLQIVKKGYHFRTSASIGQHAADVDSVHACTAHEGADVAAVNAEELWVKQSVSEEASLGPRVFYRAYRERYSSDDCSVFRGSTAAGAGLTCQLQSRAVKSALVSFGRQSENPLPISGGGSVRHPQRGREEKC
jgi:hypothetical protein